MDLRLDGKRALVTGGSRGIGLAIARALAREGVQLVLAARDGDAAEAAARALAEETGARVHAIAADTRDDASVDTLVAQTVVTLGGLEILVNAAARPGGPATVPGIAGVDTDDALVDLDTKLLGYVRTARAAAPHLVASGWGRIINISGLAARQTGSIIGSARNVAVAALTKNLADELGPKGVNVTVVHPGATRTERTAGLVAGYAAQHGIALDEAERRLFGGSLIGRIVDAEEVADVVAFLASPRSVAITGDAICVGGGMRGSIYY